MLRGGVNTNIVVHCDTSLPSIQRERERDCLDCSLKLQTVYLHWLYFTSSQVLHFKKYLTIFLILSTKNVLELYQPLNLMLYRWYWTSIPYILIGQRLISVAQPIGRSLDLGNVMVHEFKAISSM